MWEGAGGRCRQAADKRRAPDGVRAGWVAHLTIADAHPTGNKDGLPLAHLAKHLDDELGERSRGGLRGNRGGYVTFRGGERNMTR